MIDTDALEAWAGLAAQAIQEVIDEAVESSPDTPEDEVCPDLRGLLADLDRIFAGGGSLMTVLKTVQSDPGAVLNLGDQEQTDGE